MDDEDRRFRRRLRHMVRELFDGDGTAHDFRLLEGAQEIVDSLKTVLGAAIQLYDAEKHVHHAAMGRRWLSFPDQPTGDLPTGCRIRVRINDRWTLCLSKRDWLHADAESVAKWAAAKLAPFLPCRSAAEELTFPPAGGGGGTGGAAEIGIPVWWARKARN